MTEHYCVILEPDNDLWFHAECGCGWVSHSSCDAADAADFFAAHVLDEWVTVLRSMPGV